MTAADSIVAAERLRVSDPRDDSLIGELDCDDRETVAATVRRARDAARDWAARPTADRAALLHRAAAALDDHVDELAELQHRETGRAIAECREGVEAGASTLRQYAEYGPLHRGRSLHGDGLATDYTRAEPYGVAAVITPWNDPVAIAGGLLGAALVTGNTAVHKPSERCPHLGRRLGEVLSEVFPADVVTTLTGGGAVGALLVQCHDVDVVAHVGSTAAGARIGRSCAQTGAHLICENGGNDPLVVDEDVDPLWAARQAAQGAFVNNGQVCTAVERIYVHQAIAEPFLGHLQAVAQEYATGGLLGPLVDREARESVHAQVTEALGDGATLACGGVLPEGAGAWYPPTVLTGCRDDMRIMAEETFGPVAPVRVVNDFDAGLAAAASGHYGLAATVLTGRIAHAQAAIAALDVGTVKINDVFGGAPGGSAQPRGSSGHGYGYGPELLDEFARTKVIHVAASGDAS